MYGFADAYQEILRSSNIGSIEDVEFERAILSNCMPGGLLGKLFYTPINIRMRRIKLMCLDEIVDEDEMDSYASDEPLAPQQSIPSSIPDTSQPPPNQSLSLTSRATDLLAFIDESTAVTPTSGQTPSVTSTPAVSIPQSSVGITASSAPSSISRLPMRHEIVQMLAEAAERHSSSNMEIPTSTGASVLPHELVLTM